MLPTEKNTPQFAPSFGASAELPAACYPPRTAQDVVNNLKNTDAAEVHANNLHDLFTEWVVSTQCCGNAGRQEAFYTYTTLRLVLKDEVCCPAAGVVEDIALSAAAHLQSLEEMFTELMSQTRWLPERRQQMYQTYIAMRTLIKDAQTVAA